MGANKMDDFKKAGARSVGPVGVKCGCCFDYHRFGGNSKKLSGFSKLRRSRLKRDALKLIMEGYYEL